MIAKTGDNMTEFEKMEAGLVYDCNDKDILNADPALFFGAIVNFNSEKWSE